jgi:hypothetical protein
VNLEYRRKVRARGSFLELGIPDETQHGVLIAHDETNNRHLSVFQKAVVNESITQILLSVTVKLPRPHRFFL